MSDGIDSLGFEPVPDLWSYRARPDPTSYHKYGVVDGDTYDLMIDLGLGQIALERIRAIHLDTAEVYSVSSDSEEYQVGKEQTEFVRDWILDAAVIGGSNWPLVVRTYREEGGSGRYLAEVFNQDGESLEEAVIDEYGEEYLYEP